MSHSASAEPSPQPTPQPKKPAPRRWWEKQRWIVVIAAVILGLAVLAVIMFLRADSQTPTAADAGATPTAGPSTPGASDPAAARASEPGTGPAEGGRDSREPRDQRLAQVCDRIIAFQENLSSGDIEPLSAMSELSEIERQARGTRLDDRVDAVGNTVQDFFLGQADADEVITAGSELATAC